MNTSEKILNHYVDDMSVARARVVASKDVQEKIKRLSAKDFNDPKNVARARKLSGVDKLLKTKTQKITLDTLLKNAEQLFGTGRTQERRVNTIDFTASPGVNTLTVRATTTTSKGEKGVPKSVPRLYKTNMVFLDMEFTDTKDKKHPIPFNVGIGSDKQTYWMEFIDKKKHSMLISCTCKDQQFTSQWYAAKRGILFPGAKPIPYRRLTPPPPKGRPFANKFFTPNVCKHMYVTVLDLQKRGFVKKGTVFFKNIGGAKK